MPAEDYEPMDTEADDDRDHWQEYKDDLAMGRIYPDGTQRDMEPPDPEECL